MKTTSIKPKDWCEGRRLRGWDLYQQGWKQKDIAEALGVSEGAVSQWIVKGTAGGREGLRKRKSPGAPSRLSAEQLALLPKLLERGAEAYGFRGNLWTRRRIAKVIKTEFRVAYHPDHAGRIIRRVGWSVQKPVERASQRDEHAIEHWRKERWPQIKKRPKRKGESLCG